MTDVAEIPRHLASCYEQVQWFSPFYRAVSHGVYVAFDDECYDDDNVLTKKGREFVQKKRVRAIIVQPRRRNLASTASLTVLVRPLHNFERWLTHDLKDLAKSHASIGVLVDAADSVTIVLLTMLNHYMKGVPVAQSCRSVCEAIGGGGLLADSSAQRLLQSLIDPAESHTASLLGPADLRPLTATEEALAFFVEQEKLHDFLDYDMVSQASIMNS